ncbi:hypothetical protein SAMN05660337_3389 [Maridesulfovibrio ferrireducens]|uniref:Calcineurin-like phosphoesterase domain-containing protein n=1 Tax=Maridesulfovibrio ferrireducens TaxID=246191 RepID=A0A1G9LHN3_9BACT|nr:metallophosphoesterase [Maridesulfovibrio ferrireducens]SDL61460.1 hypothetical protein SAMN05660337_3389 [Maridesulfovibrio ferrireducens]
MLSEKPKTKRGILILTDVMTASLPLTIFFKADIPYATKLFLQGTGYTWAAIIACMVPLGLCIEPIRFGMKLMAPDFIIPKVKIFAGLCLLSALMAIGGYINATSPVIRELEFDLRSSNATAGTEYDIAAITDLHAGKLMSRARVGKIVTSINQMTPDIILLVGDILDDRDAELSGAVNELARLKAPLGKYAVLGNHEYYLGDKWAEKILEEQGITVLSDEAESVDGKFLLVGRNDFSATIRNSTRKSLIEIIPDNNDLPIVVLDHTPRKLEEAEKDGVALQISGHTHNGQLFPFNFIIDKIYEKGWGPFQKGKTWYYISCGVGFWGPPMRTNSRPEILLIHIKI